MIRDITSYSKRVLILIFTVLAIVVLIDYPSLRWLRECVVLRVSGKKTVSDRLSEYGQIVEGRLLPCFERANVSFPPDEVVFLALKQEKQFQVYARNSDGPFQNICAYSIFAASGKSGPKLKEGDRQVPEGIYRIESLNPNSLYHLSMKVGYPNAFDREIAAREGRTNLGGDIMIHGNQVSIGCIALGDQASEDMFVLVARTGIEKVKVIISPIDLRTRPRSDVIPEKSWVSGLYDKIEQEMRLLKTL